MTACSAFDQKFVDLSPGSALLIPEVNAIDILLRALLKIVPTELSVDWRS